MLMIQTFSRLIREISDFAFNLRKQVKKFQSSSVLEKLNGSAEL